MKREQTDDVDPPRHLRHDMPGANEWRTIDKDTGEIVQDVLEYSATGWVIQHRRDASGALIRTKDQSEHARFYLSGRFVLERKPAPTIRIHDIAPGEVFADAGPTPSPQPLRVRMKADNAAEILIYSDIGETWFGDGVTAKMVADQLKELGAVDTIDVRINSYGGDVFDGLAIYRLLVENPAEITTHIDGIAASAASIIAMAGKTISMSESGFLMIHCAWSIGIGNATELRATADRLDATDAELAKIYAMRSGAEVSAMLDFMQKETWFNAEDAKAEGLIDEIAQNQRVAARAVPGFVEYVRNYERIPPQQRPFRNLPETTIVDERADRATARLQQMKATIGVEKLKRAARH